MKCINCKHEDDLKNASGYYNPGAILNTNRKAKVRVEYGPFKNLENAEKAAGRSKVAYDKVIIIRDDLNYYVCEKL